MPNKVAISFVVTSPKNMSTKKISRASEKETCRFFIEILLMYELKLLLNFSCTFGRMRDCQGIGRKLFSYT